MSESKFWLISGFHGNRDFSQQIGGPVIDIPHCDYYAVYEEYTMNLTDLCRPDPDLSETEAAEMFAELANAYLDEVTEKLKLLVEYLYDDVFFIVSNRDYPSMLVVDIYAVAPVEPEDYLRQEYDYFIDAETLVKIAKAYDRLNNEEEAIKAVLGNISEEELERWIGFDWQDVLDAAERHENAMKELEDFRRRCRVEKGYLVDVDVTGLYTLHQGEYRDENIVLFRPREDSSLRYIMDRKTLRIWSIQHSPLFEHRPVLHLCRYIEACLKSEAEADAEKEARKREALEALFNSLGEPIDLAGREEQFAECLIGIGLKKEALALTL
ncbi:hypothetical protein Ferp_0552 [Ferroglobus placidus DSM 10642]|uniref:Uncharacterized protein n=1 Tax=Ferroglobus placidus (strain DSM 10642 / AEDII12DO) TaxID=589924 RepID=D3S392_FERPA|nr:hypothetical protein [Ferroglobus placidus]ADC64725.1 hypothetical protein Ferp_0552 [Ferroglobus placidus DSM 10642]